MVHPYDTRLAFPSFLSGQLPRPFFTGAGGNSHTAEARMAMAQSLPAAFSNHVILNVVYWIRRSLPRYLESYRL
jgi:hypothetical protein